MLRDGKLVGAKNGKNAYLSYFHKKSKRNQMKPQTVRIENQLSEG